MYKHSFELGAKRDGRSIGRRPREFASEALLEGRPIVITHLILFIPF